MIICILNIQDGGKEEPGRRSEPTTVFPSLSPAPTTSAPLLLQVQAQGDADSRLPGPLPT